MRFIWEEKDFESGAAWGQMASCSDELVIIGGKRVTSLRDGHSWEYASYAKIVEEFNKHGYVPVIAQVNPSVIIRAAEKDKFKYGAGT